MCKRGGAAGDSHALKGIAVCQFQKGHADFQASLVHLVGREEEPCVLANLPRPVKKALTIPLQVCLIIQRYMILYCCAVLVVAIEAQVRGDARSEENFHRGLC